VFISLGLYFLYGKSAWMASFTSGSM